MTEDILGIVFRILFYGAAWGSVIAVLWVQFGYQRDVREAVAETRRNATIDSHERSRGTLRLMDLRERNKDTFGRVTPIPVKVACAPVYEVPAIEEEAPVRPARHPRRRSQGQFVLPLNDGHQHARAA